MPTNRRRRARLQSHGLSADLRATFAMGMGWSHDEERCERLWHKHGDEFMEWWNRRYPDGPPPLAWEFCGPPDPSKASTSDTD